MILILIITLSFVGIVAISLLLSVIFSDKRMSAQARLLAGRASSAVPDVVSININISRISYQHVVSKYHIKISFFITSKFIIKISNQLVVSKYHIKICFKKSYQNIVLTYI